MGQTAAPLPGGLQSGSWLLQAGEEERPGELSWTAYLQPCPPQHMPLILTWLPHPIIIEVKVIRGSGSSRRWDLRAPRVVAGT